MSSAQSNLISRAGAPLRGKGSLRRYYPQVDPGAEGLISSPVVTAATRARVTDVLRLSRARNAAVVEAGPGVWVLREDLARAHALGLRTLRASALARSLPVADTHASEVSVRRRLAAGAPALIVRSGRATVGAITAVRRAPAEVTSLGERFVARLPAGSRALVDIMARCAGAEGVRAFLVGGVVRDALRAAPGGDRRDLDVVVEGDGLGFARALARALGPGGATLVTHERFLTASIVTEAGVRVDVATARSERYETPGALPHVMPSTIAEDLARRDFTINAMAVELSSGTFGLLDPFGGRDDLQRRRLRVLHPLSFVEDPTRVFRAARYAARLALALDGWSLRGQALALALGPYRALSGSRLVAELELILADRELAAALRRLGTAGAFRLFEPRYRFTRVTAARLAALEPALVWVRARALHAAPVELGLVTLLADQPRSVAAAAFGRLGLTGEPLVRVERALDAADGLHLPGQAAQPSERASSLRGLTDLDLAWLRFAGQAGVRTAVEWFVDQARGLTPALRGDDVIALGVPPGPAVARALAALRDARLDGVCADRNAEVAYVRDWVNRAKTNDPDGPPDRRAAVRNRGAPRDEASRSESPRSGPDAAGLNDPAEGPPDRRAAEPRSGPDGT